MSDTIDHGEEHPLESDYPDGETLADELPLDVEDDEGELAELEDDGLADPRP